MSKRIQKRYEEAISQLKTTPASWSHAYKGYWSTVGHWQLSSKHHDILNSLYHFLVSEGVTNWDEDDYRDHMIKVAFSDGREWDWCQGDYKGYRDRRWIRSNRSIKKTSYRRMPGHEKKEKKEARWAKHKKSWKLERSHTGWKKHIKRQSVRKERIQTKKMMNSRRYEKIPFTQKHLDWNYW